MKSLTLTVDHVQNRLSGMESSMIALSDQMKKMHSALAVIIDIKEEEKQPAPKNRADRAKGLEEQLQRANEKVYGMDDSEKDLLRDMVRNNPSSDISRQQLDYPSHIQNAFSVEWPSGLSALIQSVDSGRSLDEVVALARQEAFKSRRSFKDFSEFEEAVVDYMDKLVADQQHTRAYAMQNHLRRVLGFSVQHSWQAAQFYHFNVFRLVDKRLFDITYGDGRCIRAEMDMMTKFPSKQKRPAGTGGSDRGGFVRHTDKNKIPQGPDWKWCDKHEAWGKHGTSECNKR